MHVPAVTLSWLVGFLRAAGLACMHVLAVTLFRERRCHFCVSTQQNKEGSNGGTVVMGCYCRFKTSRTQSDLITKLMPFGCTVVKKLGSKFTETDANFLHLARLMLVFWQR